MLKINHKKLAKFVVDLRGRMNQREFARYIEKTYGEKISYTTISKLESALHKTEELMEDDEKTVPALSTIYILSKVSGVNMGEFLEFIQTPDDVSLSASKSYQESKLDLAQNPDRFLELFKLFNPEIKLHVYSAISDQMVDEAREAFKIKAAIQSIKGIGA